MTDSEDIPVKMVPVTMQQVKVWADHISGFLNTFKPSKKFVLDSLGYTEEDRFEEAWKEGIDS